MIDEDGAEKSSASKQLKGAQSLRLLERKESSEKASSARESALRIALQDSDESKLAMSAVLDVASNSKHSLKSRAA